MEKGNTTTKSLEPNVSRRTVLKGMGAATLATAMNLGGEKSGAAKAQFEASQQSNGPPPIKGEVVMGATPHNCGGRCVSKYYLEEGVVKRIVTDERPDKGVKEGNDPQLRSCVRCRSRREWFYRADRLQHPLKQTGKRGDMNGFVKISWEQAFKEIGTGLQGIYDKYGGERVFASYSSGDSTGWARDSAKHLLNTVYSGFAGYRDDYSWGAIDHMASFFEGAGYTPACNYRDDAINAEQLVVWSLNNLESIWGTQSGWLLTQIREAGVPITAVDGRVSMTVDTVADDFIAVMPGTDAALITGMLHHLLTKRLKDLDIGFIKSHVHGFFDDPEAASYHDDVEGYTVPVGASLSAFIMGNDDSLVKAGLNKATSVYPETIGYCVNKEDELFGKRAPIYGQLPKTPEWASEICGVPADKIRKFADLYLDSKVTTWMGTGLQRNSEAEQGVWLGRILSTITGNIGHPGAAWGMPSWSYVKAPGHGMNTGDLKLSFYDYDELSVPKEYLKNGTDKDLAAFVWLDNVENDVGASRWNDGQVRKMASYKALLNFGGNVLLNQNGDVNLGIEIIEDRSKAELIVTCDHFMTTSAKYSDYVLPGAMQMEKPGATTGWFGNEVVGVNQAIAPPGEAMTEYDICAGIAEAMGKKELFTEGKTMEERLSEGWQKLQAEGYYDISWEEFKKEGVWKAPTPPLVVYGEFFTNPVANPLATPSGKIEAYSKLLMEDFQARFHDNYDPDDRLVGGLIMDAKNPQGSDSARFVYPIPMYIPLVEGRHPDGSKYPHPDLTESTPKGYTYNLHTWHLMQRSHSTLNKVAWLNQQYKKDADGNPAFISNKSTSLNVWEEGVYESVIVNSDHEKELGMKTGDKVKISNDRGAIYASVIFSQLIPKGYIMIGQGSWTELDADGVDIGGNANCLISLRPSRIAKAMTLANDCRVAIVKA
ncbi:molybdopterin-containing oxidoreductase family protein [Desulfosediminicola sp.]|uniref:molybdopterin-containing oxidoreductase family protein n=1 Tax=Desulfosediminicola sp. TaxID=2886825 RepID=UPI003AF226DF